MKTLIFIFLVALTVECNSQVVEEGTYVEQVWMKTYDGPANDEERVDAMAVDNNGNVIVTGTCNIFKIDKDYVTIKYSPSGIVLWEKRYDYNNSSDEAAAMTIDNAGNIYVTGRSNGNRTIATIKYNSSGTQLWAKRYTAPNGGYNEGKSIAVDNAGNVYVTGVSDHQCTTIKYSSSGVQQWINRYYSPNSENDQGTHIGVDAGGNVYISGTKYLAEGNSWDYLTIKYNSSGVIQWVQIYDGPGHGQDVVKGFAIDDNGNIFITGESIGNGTYLDYATIKYSSDGWELWIKRYNQASNSTDVASSLAIDDIGNVYVTGFSDGFETGGRDITTIKYTSAGSQQWLQHYNGDAGQTDQGKKIVIDNSRNVYVTGYSWNDNYANDYVTIKYNSAGGEKWVQKYQGNREDFAITMAVDNSKNVYVSGISTCPDWYRDIRTIKYTQSRFVIQNRFETPKTFSLSQNYPNPFNPVTKITFSIPNNSYTKLMVYDISGKQVAELVDSELDAGTYGIDFDGSSLASGTYFYRIIAGNFTEVKKMILVK